MDQQPDEEQNKEIADAISKLRALNIIDSNFKINGYKLDIKWIAANRSRRLVEMFTGKEPVAVHKPIIWTKEDCTRHEDLREKHMKEKYPELNETSEEEIRMENRRIAVQTVKAYLLRRLMKPHQTLDRWFVVVDTKVLLDDMWFVEKLVSSDPFCQVMVPYETLCDLNQMTMESHPDWMRTPAQRVLQLLDEKSGALKKFNQQGVLENEDLIDNIFATDAVLNCCMQIMRRLYFVVLVTDDKVRTNWAKIIDLPSYTLAELKDDVTLSYPNLHYGFITVTREFN